MTKLKKVESQINEKLACGEGFTYSGTVAYNHVLRMIHELEDEADEGSKPERRGIGSVTICPQKASKDILNSILNLAASAPPREEKTEKETDVHSAPLSAYENEFGAFTPGEPVFLKFFEGNKMYWQRVVIKKIYDSGIQIDKEDKIISYEDIIFVVPIRPCSYPDYNLGKPVETLQKTDALDFYDAICFMNRVFSVGDTVYLKIFDKNKCLKWFKCTLDSFSEEDLYFSYEGELYFVPFKNIECIKYRRPLGYKHNRTKWDADEKNDSKYKEPFVVRLEA